MSFVFIIYTFLFGDNTFRVTLKPSYIQNCLIMNYFLKVPVYFIIGTNLKYLCSDKINTIITASVQGVTYLPDSTTA